MKNKIWFSVALIILLTVPVYAKTTLNVDINNDGVTNNLDAALVAEKIIDNNSVNNIADIDKDGLVKINDVIILLTNINGLIPINEISFEGASSEITVDDDITIVPLITPYYANEDITYVSSNTNIASVDSRGTVTGVSAGTATITARTSTGKTATYNLTVNKKVIDRLVIYLSPDGDDNNDGTNAHPIKTLSRAFQLQQEKIGGNDVNEIRIIVKPGNYTNQSLRWDQCYENATIKIMGDANDMPTFTGPAEQTALLSLFNANNCRFMISNIKITHYNDGIMITSKGNSDTGNNVIENVVLSELGDYYTGSEISGKGGIILRYSSNNIIRNNTLEYLLNGEGVGNYIHGVYIASKSSNNAVYQNEFSNIKPDPIRIRDRSNNNRIAQNTFTNTGFYAYCSELYYNNDKYDEDISTGNTFYDNILYGGYNGATIDEIAIFKVNSSEKDDPDPTRLKASGNTIMNN